MTDDEASEVNEQMDMLSDEHERLAVAARVMLAALKELSSVVIGYRFAAGTQSRINNESVNRLSAVLLVAQKAIAAAEAAGIKTEE